MRILLTGGAGFIGSNLTDFLVNKGNTVIVIDDLSSGKLENLSIHLENRDIDFIESRVEDVDLNAFRDIDGVIHLAAQASVPLSVSDFRNSSSTNLLSSLNIINYCVINKLPLVYASSSAVYGDLEKGNDQSKEVDLLTPYSVDKLVLELYSEVFFKIKDLSSVGLRFFNVYGPRQDPSSPYSGVISIFIDRLLNDKKIQINGGNQTRDFIFIDDVVKCIYDSLILCRDKLVNKRLNILTGIETSVEELADKIASYLNVVPQKEYLSLPPGDPLKSNGSTQEMNRVLGKDPKQFFNLTDGLEKTINYIKEND
ncbi:MAG: hypothetical protein CMG57_06635 [Candidatus Marinimicrobia bacterium]|nr:hypothetical protein [Candidatus Neomarinimicrobiota bacterium]